MFSRLSLQMRASQLFATALLAAMASTTFGLNAQYYVSTAGNDNNPGSSALPWRTLQHAADIADDGDRVTVRQGSYVGFDLRHSGALNAPIEFFAEPGAIINSPSTVRTRNGEPLDGINLEGASHVIIDGFTITGMPEAGVRTVGFSNDFATNVTVRNVMTSNNGVWGIFTGHVNNLLIESNTTSGSIDEHGIYVSNSGDNPVIRNNVSFNNHGSGIHMNGDLSQGGDGIISNALISGNRIYNNAMPNTAHPTLGGGSGINMDGVQDSRIENNLVYNNHASGISLYSIDGAAGSTGNVVVNNTIHQPSDGRWALNIRDESINNTAYNNILLNDHQFRGAINLTADSVAGFTSNYNAVISRFSRNDGSTVLTLPNWTMSTGQDANSFVATAAALFVNAGAGDYRLSSTSPARNAGTSQLAPFGDLNGLPRPAGGAFDIGAYEFGALAGDYNRDGQVSTADYILWRKTLGASVARYAGADGSGNGAIDTDDFGLWRAGFGAVPAAGAGVSSTIPEPVALPFLVAAAIVGIGSARLRRFQLG
jgi:parallel beta-helix repeat protein